jgi:biuret amidohydrolase
MLRTYGLEISQTLDEACDRSRAALIVYDMQVGILRQLKDGPAITSKVAEVLGAARDAGVRVVFMRHLSLPLELTGATQLRTAMAWQRVRTVEEVHPWFLRDSAGFQIAPEVAPLSSEAIFDKITMSAFESTPLAITLRDCGVSTFIIAGVATEIGIEPTIRHGVDLGFIPVMVTDACGSGHKEAGERALANLRFLGDAFFTDVKEICGILRSQTHAVPRD